MGTNKEQSGTAEDFVALCSTCSGHDALFCVLQRNGLVYKK